MTNTDDKYKVLLLEDEPVISRVLTRYLTIEGFDVDVAANGLIAKEKIDQNKKYDLMIFDIKTPVINGMQLFEHLKKEHPDMVNKVIFATGDNLNTETHDFLERAKRPQLLKPYMPTQIKELMLQTITANIALA
jgi:DNA-binding response OmpR family regulator